MSHRTFEYTHDRADARRRPLDAGPRRGSQGLRVRCIERIAPGTRATPGLFDMSNTGGRGCRAGALLARPGVRYLERSQREEAAPRESFDMSIRIRR